MLKVIHLPYNIGSHPSTLSKYENEVGLISKSYSYHISNIYVDKTNAILKNDNGIILNEFNTLYFYFKIFNKYDIIHYNFGSTLLPVKKFSDEYNHIFPKPIKKLYDFYGNVIRICELKSNTSKIFVTFQGDDGRIGSELEKNNPYIKTCTDIFFNRLKNIENQILKRNRIFEKYAYKIYVLNPDLANYFEKKAEFLPYASFDVNKQDYIGLNNGSKITIGHAPSDKETKGTKYVLDAIERLKSEGYNIEFKLIEKHNRKDALKIYKTFDLLIDQLIIGWYGGLALEVMTMGKPVICYINEHDLKNIPLEMKKDLPIINANLFNLKDVIKTYIINNKSQLKNIGIKSREYALKWHNPKIIAMKMKKDYEEALNINRDVK